ncbi:MAG: hypothetical protein AAB393_18505 [Bacteroidota bacterium]
MALEAELALFEDHRDEWLREHEGQFALVKGTEHAFYDSDEDAYRASVEKYGRVDVLIKQVVPVDLVEDSPSLLYGLLNAPR